MTDALLILSVALVSISVLLYCDILDYNRKLLSLQKRYSDMIDNTMTDVEKQHVSVLIDVFSGYDLVSSLKVMRCDVASEHCVEKWTIDNVILMLDKSIILATECSNYLALRKGAPCHP